MRILTNTVDTCVFYPPDTALYQVSSNMAVALIEVRHGQSEPTVDGYFLFIIGGIRVHLSGSLKAGLHVVALEVEPVFGRHILEQVIV